MCRKTYISLFKFIYLVILKQEFVIENSEKICYLGLEIEHFEIYKRNLQFYFHN